MLWPTAAASQTVQSPKSEERVAITMQIQSLPVVAKKPVPKPVLKPTTNGFAKGNCTYYVALRRAKMGKPVTWRGNAGMWFENAKKQGYAVSARPKVGAIYVTRQESSRGSKLGHVAIIEKIVGSKMLT